MKRETKQLDELKKFIKVEHQNCNHDQWPKLCEMQSTEKGYKRVEDMIVRYVATEGMPIGSAIAHIEQELSHQGEN